MSLPPSARTVISRFPKTNSASISESSCSTRNGRNKNEPSTCVVPRLSNYRPVPTFPPRCEISHRNVRISSVTRWTKPHVKPGRKKPTSYEKNEKRSFGTVIPLLPPKPPIHSKRSLRWTNRSRRCIPTWVLPDRHRPTPPDHKPDQVSSRTPFPTRKISRQLWRQVYQNQPDKEPPMPARPSLPAPPVHPRANTFQLRLPAHQFIRRVWLRWHLPLHLLLLPWPV